jgi:hypothetical protein
MAPDNLDRRNDKRLSLSLPVRFSKDPDDTLSPHEGVTHNVSSGGLYFEAPMGRQLNAADPVWVQIAVPGGPGEEKHNLTLMGSGVICRVDKLDHQNRVGAWPDGHSENGFYGIAVQFDQRPTVQLQSFEELLWEK